MMPFPTDVAARPSSPSRSTAPPTPVRGVGWLREPLLHFLLIGALLFGADHLLLERADDPNTIVVGKEVTAEASRLFLASSGRPPSPQELEALSRRWIDNEILYREGMALRVEQGDTMIRDRVIFKALRLVETGLKPVPPTEATLRAWFETQRAKYDEPARFDFQEAVLSGDSAEPAVAAFVQTLNAGGSGDARAGLRVFKGRPRDNLVQSYGDDFAKALETAPVGEWRVLPTRDGPRAVRLDTLTRAAPARFEALRDLVQIDWTDATMAQMRTDAVRQRGQKYRLKFEGSTP